MAQQGQQPQAPRAPGVLMRLLQGPVSMLVISVAVLWYQGRLDVLGLARAPSTPAAAPVAPVEPKTCDVSASGAEVQRFAKFLTFRSVGSSTAPDHIPPETQQHFEDMLAFLEHEFPLVWEHLEVEKTGSGGWSRLFTWYGSDSTLNPVLYISHYDVVPVAAEKESEWQHGPFDGQIVDGVVWGRGALDVKYSVTSLLEAVTRLLKSGYQPRRTIMLTFGHDEELGGDLGAGLTAQLLESKGVKLDVIVDEGGTVFVDGFKGVVNRPVAVVGTAEKMYTSLELTFHSSGGHSSMPPTDGSDVATQFSRLVAWLHAQKPPAELRPPITDFVKAVAPFAPWYAQPCMSNPEVWPCKSIITERFAKAGNKGNALVRTTIVVTRVNAGVADNVLPQSMTVTLNTRHHPDIARQEVIDYINNTLTTIRIKADIRVTNASYSGPTGQVKVAPTDGTHYQKLKTVIQEYWRDGEQPVLVVPMLLTGGTDSKWYSHLSQHGILRFVPYRMLSEAEAATGALSHVPPMAGVHATDERVLAEDYARSICTYDRLIRLLADD